MNYLRNEILPLALLCGFAFVMVYDYWTTPRDSTEERTEA